MDPCDRGCATIQASKSTSSSIADGTREHVYEGCSTGCEVWSETELLRAKYGSTARTESHAGCDRTPNDAS